MGRPRRRDRGQALAEFALVAPILFLLLFGVIQLGLLMASQNGLVNGVRDATRKAATWQVNDLSFAAMGGLCGDVNDQLETELSAAIPGFVVGNLTTNISYEWKAEPDSTHWFVIAHISATYDNPLYIPLIGVILHPSDPAVLPLGASEQMRVENPGLTPSDTSDQNC